ncbi:MAG: glycoside hydrolase domain-containing protein [Anaerolineae bacterium]
MSKNNPSHLHIIGLNLTLIVVLLGVTPSRVLTHADPTHPTDAADAWWDDGWPYRIPVTVSESGVVEANINFTTVFNALGLNHALLDLRSIRVVPYSGNTPGTSVPYAESYSTMLEDADIPQIGWSGSGVYWTVNDGSAEADITRFSQGSASLKATVENLSGGYGYPGVELHIASGDPKTDWSDYETLIYDVWPEVNASALDQAPDLYWFKLYNACGGSPVTQGGPPLALDQWNYASVSLNPLDSCWPADGLDLSNITRAEFHTRDDVDGDVSGPNGFWDDGDVLTLWFDNMRLVDQDSGSIKWNADGSTTKYYVYFDVLTHEGHSQPTLDEGLGSATLTGTPGTPEAGGYYHQITGATLSGLQIWAAPTVEKVLKTMAVPVASDSLRIAAARGEFEPFQIVVQAPSAQSLNVSVSDFVKSSDVITDVTVHRVDYVNLTTFGDHFDRPGWWPDPLWPLDSGDAVSFPANENQPLWFTVRVPWDAAPGVYQATVTVGSASVPVELEVWNFSLPREIHLDSEWGFDWSSIVEDVYQGTAGDWNCYWEMVEAFKQDFYNHRLIPKGVAWPAGLNYPGGVAYDCNGNLDPDAGGDWDFATIGGKYIHSEDGFNDGYGFPVFLSHGPTENDPAESLPYDFCGEPRSGVLGSAAFQAKWTQYLSAVDAYIVSDGYDDAAYYHIVNEPQTLGDYTIVGQISALIESAAPHLRQLVSEQVEPDIYNYPGAKINIWMPTISSYEPIKSHDRQKNYGEEVWWYYLYGDDPPLPNPILMSHPGMEARITPWLAWAERVDGLLHYSTTDWSSNPWTTPNVTGQDNGDGFFFYPPRKDGSNLSACGENGHRLVPSIRWENLRDGMEDYEYLWLLAKGDPQIDVANDADTYVAQLVQSRTRFSHVPTDLDATRAAIALALGGPTASKSVSPRAIAPGGDLTYTLTYTHSGDDAALVVTDPVPSMTPVITATGPGTLQVIGQEVNWSVPVSAGQSVTLTIQATAATTPGVAVNTAIFSGTQVLTREVTVLIYRDRVFLPVVLK